MDYMNQRMIEMTLHRSLSNYGLNPIDWKLEFNNKNQSEVIVINKEDGAAFFKGKTKVSKKHGLITASWIFLTLI